MTALIAAASALAGAILTNYLTRKDRQAEREHRGRQEAADFLIGRGEDLYVHLDRIEAYIVRHTDLIALYCNGRLQFDEFKLARGQAQQDLEQAAMSRVKLNVRAFFPKLLPLHEEMVTNLSRLETIDQALIQGNERKADLLYRVYQDTLRLRDTAVQTGEQLRSELAQDLAAAFAARSASGIRT